MRNRLFSNFLISLLATFLIIYFFVTLIYSHGDLVANVTWLFFGALILLNFYAYTLLWLPADRKLHHYAKARVIAIIPAFNETDESVHLTVESLLAQSVELQAIYVVDDGSALPIKPYTHSKVTWFRTENAGKRMAQYKAIQAIHPEEVDFILTIDSDSEIEATAVENMLCAFERDPALTACTGFIVASNFNENIITRIGDLNVGISCVLTRPSRSITGSIETTSGALSIYKKEVLFDNMSHYISTGTYSDDRQLCLYALLSGRVIGVAEAIAYTKMPTSTSELFKQRIRWGKGSWKYYPFQIINLRLVHLFFPLLGMVQWIVTPFFMAFLVFVTIKLSTAYFLLSFIGIKLTIRYLQSALYLLASSHMNSVEKFITWLVITPLDCFFMVVVSPLLKYYSLMTLGKEGWLTRK